MSLLACFRRCRSGTTSIEFAIVGMVFLMLSFGTIEFGRALWIRNHISHAVDVGARVLLLNSDVADAVLQSAVRDAFVHGNADQLVITVVSETDSGVTYRKLQVQYPLRLFVPGLAQPVITFDLEQRIPQV